MYGLSSVSRHLTRFILAERSLISPIFVRAFSEATEATAKISEARKNITMESAGQKQEQTSSGKATIQQDAAIGTGLTSEMGRRRKREPNLVYVGNIPMEAGENELHNLFSKIGPVKRFRRPFDKKTGIFRGFGFCEFQDETAANIAKEKMNGHEMYGRKLVVN